MVAFAANRLRGPRRVNHLVLVPDASAVGLGESFLGRPCRLEGSPVTLRTEAFDEINGIWRLHVIVHFQENAERIRPPPDTSVECPYTRDKGR
jgi:hypothetical protein